MIVLTPHGHTVVMTAIQGVLKRIHLFTMKGELEGYGYAPKDIDQSQFKDGKYPDQTWEFEDGTPIRVLGYYLTDSSKAMIFSEEFNEDVDGDRGFKIGKKGDRILVGVNLRVLSGGS